MATMTDLDELALALPETTKELALTLCLLGCASPTEVTRAHVQRAAL